MGFPRKITATTQLIATVYGYPYEYRTKPPAGWVYANEPYVRRVISYIAYYQAKEKNDVARAQAVYALIKKGDYDAAYKMAQPVYWTAGKKDAPPAKLLIGAALGLAALGVILFKDN